MPDSSKTVDLAKRSDSYTAESGHCPSADKDMSSGTTEMPQPVFQLSKSKHLEGRVRMTQFAKLRNSIR